MALCKHVVQAKCSPVLFVFKSSMGYPIALTKNGKILNEDMSNRVPSV